MNELTEEESLKVLGSNTGCDALGNVLNVGDRVVQLTKWPRSPTIQTISKIHTGQRIVFESGSTTKQSTKFIKIFQ
jgi:hypothetical protein